jgi:hypothetical protein
VTRRGDVVAVAHHGDGRVVEQCPSRRHRHRTDARDLAPFAGLDVASRERGGIDDGADLDGLARPFAGQRNECVGRVCAARLTPPGPASVLEDPLEMPVPGRAEPRAGVGGEAVGAIGICPLVRAALDVQATGPRSVVGLRTGAHRAAPVGTGRAGPSHPFRLPSPATRTRRRDRHLPRS